MKKMTWLLLSFLLAAVVLSACGDKDDKEKNDTENSAQEGEMPEPDLEGIPKVVAEVNGEEITKEDFESIYQQQFQQFMMQAQMSGQEADEDMWKEQTAEGMVGQELLTQEANDRFPDVSKDDVNKTIDDLVEQFGMKSKDDMFAQFKEQGLDEKEVMSEIETQVRIDKLVAEDAGDTEPTDKELEEAYEMMKSQQEAAGEKQEGAEELPKFDEMKPQIKEQLQQQKQAEEMEKIVKKLREKADVKIHI